MAKGNLFQGMGRGKVGDVVFSRLNGEQIARVRNRNPHNPRTNAQLYQRALMATVMQAYSFGKEIFDHSFEGAAVGAENQRKFMALNTKKLRATLANEVSSAADVSNCCAKVLAPGIATIVPNEYLVSDGSLAESEIDADDNVFRIPGLSTGDEFTQQVKDWVAETGLKVGENHTLIVINTLEDSTLFTAPGAADLDYGKVAQGVFAWVRLSLKAEALTMTNDVSSAKLSDVFNFEASANAYTGFMDRKLLNSSNSQFARIYTDEITGNQLAGENNPNIGCAYGVIHSIENSGLRSRTILKLRNPDKFGLPYSLIIPSWRASSQNIGDSDLILEGGE